MCRVLSKRSRWADGLRRRHYCSIQNQGDGSTYILMALWNENSSQPTLQLKFPFETTAVIEVTTLEVSVPGFSMHSCSHYHWVDWPDRGVPPADMAPLYFLNQFSNSRWDAILHPCKNHFGIVRPHFREPIVIHCSAGIGRTGSMVLLQYAMEVLEKGDVLKSMSVYLDEVRAQRSCSVQVITSM